MSRERDALPALPPLVALTGLGAVVMLIAALHAAETGDGRMARAFVYHAALITTGAVIVALALAPSRRRGGGAREQLLGLAAAFTLWPALMALPIADGLQVGFGRSWAELISAATTTGAEFIPHAALPRSALLYLGLVAWLGGLVWLVGVLAVLAPLELGGFELFAHARHRRAMRLGGGENPLVWPRQRLRRALRLAAPPYVALTAVLWLALVLAGHRSFDALLWAMGTLATSGIGPAGAAAPPGIAGQALVAAFLLAALSRAVLIAPSGGERRAAVLRADPELRLGLGLIAAVVLFTLLRHASVGEAGRSLYTMWSELFTLLSFLTTAGWSAPGWALLGPWSGLDAPGLLLLMLALIGGGIATTAGGIKLLRVWALAGQSRRELERLIEPSSVGGAGRALRREGAVIAWVAFMLLLCTAAAVMAAVTVDGVPFEAAAVHALAALTTTGPLVGMIDGGLPPAGALDSFAQGALAAAMVVGRLETLVVVALFNPDFWR